MIDSGCYEGVYALGRIKSRKPPCPETRVSPAGESILDEVKPADFGRAHFGF